MIWPSHHKVQMYMTRALSSSGWQLVTVLSCTNLSDITLQMFLNSELIHSIPYSYTLSTLMCLQTHRFSSSSKMHLLICPHCCLNAFLTVQTNTCLNNRITCGDISLTPHTCYKHMCLRYFQSLLSFWCVLTVHTSSDTIYMHFHFDLLSKHSVY